MNHSANQPTEHVVVIGGGVVGLTSAWWLVEAGYRVTLLERLPDVGGGASLRNGGQLSYRYVAPLADTGVPLKALQWLFQEDGPLRFKLEADPRQWRWLFQFLLNCRSKVNRETSTRLLELGELSRRALAELELQVPLSQFAWRDAGKLIVYRSPSVLTAATSGPPPSYPREILNAAQCAAREPALAAVRAQLAGGIYTGGEAVADCHAFCLALHTRLRQHPRFAGVVHGQAQRFVTLGDRVMALQTTAGALGADAFVLAAGIQSRSLAATAGISLPLYPLKGYSLTAPVGAQHQAPEISVTDFERKVLYARIGGNLRVAAMVDMVGEDDSINPRRIAGLTRLARATMPAACDYDQAIAWAGLRPATPSGAPILGASRYRNLWLNVGHGALGFTLACGSASILAGMMRGKAPPISLAGLELA